MQNENLSNKHYIIKAIYDWCNDCGYDPQLLVVYHPICNLPKQFVDSDNEVVFSLNINQISNLNINKNCISFSAFFNSTEPEEIYIHIECIKGIYALQTSDGIMFDVDLSKINQNIDIDTTLITSSIDNKIDKLSNKPLFKRVK